MILMPTDEAKAFDELSILDVKILKQPNIINKENYRIQEEGLIKQLGSTRYGEIICSEEYVAMCQANLNLFNHIDDVKKKVLTQEELKSTDMINYERFLCKKKLQGKFFPESPLREQKIGYN